MEQFTNRQQAGKQLAKACVSLRGFDNAIVLALPRGGVPVAYELAKALQLPLDVYLVRKIGMPGNEEFALGAIASGHVMVRNDEKQFQSLDTEIINALIHQETKELQRRELLYRQGRKPLRLAHKTIILVDDGIATGATMRAAIESIKLQNPEKIIIAVPVAAEESLEELCPMVYQCICLLTPYDFYAVGAYYEQFHQVEDEEVTALLSQAIQNKAGFDEK